MQPLGVVTGRHHQCGGGVGADTEEVEQIRDSGDQEGLDPGVELGDLVIERFDPMSKRGQRRLGGCRHRVGRSRRPQLGPFSDKSRHREAFEAATELFWGGEAEVAHLDQGLDPSLAG